MKPNYTNATCRLNPWDAAKKIKVLRRAAPYPLADLEPGVKFFVLMLEQLGAATLYSCEGHPRGFYVRFSCSYETALRISACGYFAVEICGSNIWTMRISESQRVQSQRRKAQLLRRAATAWESKLGKLKVGHRHKK
jgi:hypothetical protein